MTSIRNVAVVDDDPSDLELTLMAVESAGFSPVEMPELESLDAAVGWVQANADAVVSDHQLLWGELSPFTGAALISRCYQVGIPGVLVTGFIAEVDTGIRRYRREIPELVPRNELDGGRVETALYRAQAELSDQTPTTRKPHRALLRIDRVNADAKHQVYVVVPQWDGRVKISLLAEKLGQYGDIEDLAELQDRRFFATINTGAEDAGDLYFEDVTEAGPVPSDEELQ